MSERERVLEVHPFCLSCFHLASPNLLGGHESAGGEGRSLSFYPRERKRERERDRERELTA